MSLKIPRNINTTLDVIDNINRTSGPKLKRCKKCGKAIPLGSKRFCDTCHGKAEEK